MPDQNLPTVAAFNPAAFSLPASLSTADAPNLAYRVIANPAQPSLSSYVQTVFHRSAGMTSPGARLTDQAEPAVRNAEDMPFDSNEGTYFQSNTASQTFAPPIVNRQQYQNQPTQPYHFTDQTPAVGDAIYYPPAPVQSNDSFAPPADRSVLPYVPKESTQPSQRSEAIESVLEVSKQAAPQQDSDRSDSTRSQALIEKTKLIDLRPRAEQSAKSTLANQPARDTNTTVNQASEAQASAELYSETGFLKRQPFSNKFSVTRDKVQQTQSTNKIIFLKSAPASERSARLEVPQFQPQATSIADPVSPIAETQSVEQPTPPKLVPDYAMLPPTPPQTPADELTSTISESTTFVPETISTGAPEAISTEPAATFTNPFKAVEEDTEQSVETDSLPAKEAEQVSVTVESPFRVVVTESVETETQQVEPSSETIVDKIQSIEQTLNKGGSLGFSDADFAQIEKAESVAAVPVRSTNSQNNAFQVAGYRQAKANTKAGFLNASPNQRTENVAEKASQIILPKFKSSPTTSFRNTQTQLTAMTLQNTKQEGQQGHGFEMPWLSPWWMLIGLIPLALYLGTTKLFQDEEEEFAYYENDLGSSKPVEFGSDFGKIGGSKSDAIYGNEDTLAGIESTIRHATNQPLEASSIEPDSITSPSTIAFAESLIFELPSTEACADPSLAKELSLHQSPNFSDTVEIDIEIHPTEKKKARKRKSGKRRSKRQR